MGTKPARPSVAAPGQEETPLDQPGVSFEKAEVAWDVRTQAPAIFAGLTAREPGLASILNRLAAGCPIAATCRAFESGRYFRPTGHARSFCLKTEGGGCVVFKGTEPMSSDYDEILREAWELRPSFNYSALEHFILRENEIYLALTVAGVLFCARQSLDWVAAYSGCFGRLPKTPIPLMVYRVPEEHALRFASKIRPFLSDRGQNSAAKRFDKLSEEGLGVYAYYYPGTPLRAAHALRKFPGSHGVNIGWEERLGPKFSAQAAIEGWIDIVSDMLVAGYLPTTPIHTGNCLQEQNLATDGGLCDIDSIERMDRIKNEKDFLNALLYSMNVLVASVMTTLNLKDHAPVHGAIWAAVWGAVQGQVREKSKGRKCDVRLVEYVAGEGTAVLARLVKAVEPASR